MCECMHATNTWSHDEMCWWVTLVHLWSVNREKLSATALLRAYTVRQPWHFLRAQRLRLPRCRRNASSLATGADLGHSLHLLLPEADTCHFWFLFCKRAQRNVLHLITVTRSQNFNLHKNVAIFTVFNFLNPRSAFAAKGHIWNNPWTLMKFETTPTVAPWDSPRPSSSLGDCWSSALITLLIPEEICLITGPLQLTSFTCHALIWVLLISKRPTWSSTAQEAQETTFCCNQIFLKGEKEQVCATMFEDKHVLYMSEQLFLPVWWVTEKRRNDGNDSNHFYPPLLLVFVQDSLLTTTCVIHLCTRVDCKIVSLLVQLFLELF